MTNESNHKNQSQTIDDIINEIKEKSMEGDYIYRGERKDYDNVSSALYREYKDVDIDIESYDLRRVQDEMLKVAKKHIGKPTENANKGFLEFFTNALSDDELEVLTELQHYGGKTNLIDFTTDYLIAIFFACAGHLAEDGRVILLQRTADIEKEMVIRPQNPRHRVIAQKSIFLNPPNGFIDIPNDNIVYIPAPLKQPLLEYLRKFHDISAETIYNDIHGFIRNQSIHKNSYIEFYIGLTLQYRGFNAKTDAERKEHYKDAITYYDSTIELNPESNSAYNNRGECWLHLKEWKKAREDLMTAKDMGSNIIDAFRNDYENVADFEKKTGITAIPSDLVEMLGG